MVRSYQAKKKCCGWVGVGVDMLVWVCCCGLITSICTLPQEVLPVVVFPKYFSSLQSNKSFFLHIKYNIESSLKTYSGWFLCRIFVGLAMTCSVSVLSQKIMTSCVTYIFCDWGTLEGAEKEFSSSRTQVGATLNSVWKGGKHKLPGES